LAQQYGTKDHVKQKSELVITANIYRKWHVKTKRISELGNKSKEATSNSEPPQNCGSQSSSSLKNQHPLPLTIFKKGCPVLGQKTG
jgi:hypothetical protein